MSSKSTSNLPLLTQHGNNENGDYSKKREPSFGGVEHSKSISISKYRDSRYRSDSFSKNENVPYQRSTDNHDDEEENNGSNPSFLYILCMFLFGCLLILIGIIFYEDSNIFNLSDDVNINESYFLLILSFGISFISYSIWNIFQIYFNCCIRDLNMTGFTIFFLILGICLLTLSIIGFLDEYVDSYDNYDIVSYPIYLIFSLFGVSIICFVICWVHIKYKEKHDKAMVKKNFYFEKMLKEEGDQMDYKLPENKDKLPPYIVKNGIIHPYDRSIVQLIWQTLTHSWLFNIIYLGSKQTLQSYDMYLPPKGDDIEYQMEKWLHESEKYKKQHPNESFSSFRVLWNIERNSFCVRFGFMCIATLSGLVVPQIIGELAEFYESPELDVSYGVYLCIGLLLAGLLRIELVAIVFTLAGRAVARIKSLLTYAIYYKAINMSLSSSSTDSELSSGQKITLIAADTRIIAFAVGFEPMFLANAVLLVMVIVFLHIEIGVSATAGWIFMIFVSGPIQGIVGKQVQMASKAYIFQSDSRVKFIGELIRGIRVTKMYAWERALMDEILNYRKKEMTQLLIKIKFISIMSMINIATPQFMALIMFGTYILLGNALTIRTVFAVITLIQLIRISIRILPYAIMLGVGAAVGFGRLNTFFNASEQKDMLCLMDDNNTAGDDDSDRYMVYLKDASFKWPKIKKRKEDEKNEKKEKKNGKQNTKGMELVESDDEDQGEEDGDDEQKIEIDDGKDYEFLLEKISMKLTKGKLYALVGSVGSGKSSLIQALLKEMKMVDGYMKVNNGDEPIGYVAQTAFIMNDTVRENILWGLPFDKEFYSQCLEASSLKHDLSILANGDLTEIGERGINLSGGQKQRISFCRSLYRSKYNANLYLLDDPLSAVDSHVGNNMFHRGIKTVLKDKTVLLVMNSHLHLLKYMDEILIIDKGKLVVQATYKQVMENEEYAHLLPDKGDDTNEEENEQQQQQQMKDKDDDKKQDEDNKHEANKSYSSIQSMLDKKRTKTAESNKTSGYGSTSVEAQQKGKLTTKEDRKAGQVAWNVYSRYFSNAVNRFDHNKVDEENYMDKKASWCNDGVLLICLEVLLLILAQAFVSGSDIWLAFWAEEDNVNRFPELNNDWWLGIWSIFIGALTILTFASSYLFGWLSNRAAQSVHMKTLFCVLRAPILYFDSTPTGRILNRFSKDTNEMDSDLVMHFTNFSQQTLQVIGYLIVIVISMPYTIFLLIIVIPGLYYLQRYFRLSSSDIKRLDQVTNTPIIAQFSETLIGLDTIRAYKTSENIFLKNIRKKIRLNHKIFLAEHMGVRWFGTYMDMVIVLFLLCITLLATFLRDQFETALLALAVVYGYAMLGMLQWAIRTSVDVEKAFTAVERLLYFETALNKNNAKQNKDTNDDSKYDDDDDDDEEEDNLITSEAKEINYSYRPPNSEWPYEGKIIIKNLKMKYRKDLDYVLCGISMEVRSGEKIGVCGRTGAGKSSLLLTLFRLVEPSDDSVIEIDGINCLQLGLRDLRRSLSIIPQEPVLFSGTLRFNLDPFNEFTDEDIWDTLKKCKLYEYIYNKEEKLNHLVSEGGANFSAGQKQLICIGRALLKKSKVLLLDEATSSIDKYTDTLIQELIRKEFKDVTVICIAHRLDTIIDYDRILVLSNGKIKEFDTPQNLLNQGDKSVFYQMVNSGHKQDNDNNNDNETRLGIQPIIEEENDNDDQ